jgi:hypothetical protein
MKICCSNPPLCGKKDDLSAKYFVVEQCWNCYTHIPVIHNEQTYMKYFTKRKFLFLF